LNAINTNTMVAILNKAAGYVEEVSRSPKRKYEAARR
jgi:hypothetical protein